jgi:leucyl/phenylalanyl-tRNA--protein transferase
MPVFRLPDEIIFPSTDLAEPNSLLAVGGDFSEERILLVYSLCIFPCYSEGSHMAYAWHTAFITAEDIR